VGTQKKLLSRQRVCRQADQITQMAPIETRPGVGFAPWRNVLVTRDMRYWVPGADCRNQCAQHAVLNRLECATLQTFKLHANGVVIAIDAAAVGGRPGVPSAVIAANTLQQLAIASNEKMR
jgi:hypothetical protein